MDFHPLVVHFPIALLTLYSFLEVLKRFTKAAHWVQTRTLLVITGTLGAWLSLATGEQAEELFAKPELNAILDAHESAAGITMWIYAILAVAYFIQYLGGSIWNQKIPNVLKNLTSKILNTPLALLLAIAGFIALGATGALGAMLVHDPQIDPITAVIYNVFFAK